jgi:hypothetical protein
MMVSRRHIQKYIGQHVHCHTHYGTFEGVIVHCTKEHIFLAPAVNQPDGEGWDGTEMASGRPYPLGPGGPMGPGPGGPMGPGPGWGGGGGGWHLAIPLAAILGITAVGMHWW